MPVSRYMQSDRSIVPLLLSNAVTVAFALIERWQVGEVMLIYWSQSVIIGYFNYRRILDLKQFSTDGVRSGGAPVAPTRATQESMARFFVLHYGLFHLVYVMFIVTDGSVVLRDYAFAFVICVIAFFLNHLYSYRFNRERDALRKPNIGTVFLFPYARILPMHLTIIFGGLLAGDSVVKLLLFLILKTGADVIMHMNEHAEVHHA